MYVCVCPYVCVCLSAFVCLLMWYTDLWDLENIQHNGLYSIRSSAGGERNSVVLIEQCSVCVCVYI